MRDHIDRDLREGHPRGGGMTALDASAAEALTEARRLLRDTALFDLEAGDPCDLCTGRGPEHNKDCRRVRFDKGMALVDDAIRRLRYEEEPFSVTVTQVPTGHKLASVTVAKEGDFVLDATVGDVTVRSCTDCGTLVAGGPTRCGFCVSKAREADHGT